MASTKPQIKQRRMEILWPGEPFTFTARIRRVPADHFSPANPKLTCRDDAALFVGIIPARRGGSNGTAGHIQPAPSAASRLEELNLPRRGWSSRSVGVIRQSWADADRAGCIAQPSQTTADSPVCCILPKKSEANSRNGTVLASGNQHFSQKRLQNVEKRALSRFRPLIRKFKPATAH